MRPMTWPSAVRAVTMVTPVANMPSAARNSCAEKLGGWALRGGFTMAVCMNFHVLWTPKAERHVAGNPGARVARRLRSPCWRAARCAPGDTVAVLSESQSRPVLPQLARLAAARLGCKTFAIVLPTLFEAPGPPVRSTGASTALQQMAPVVAALAGSTLVVDCTVEGPDARAGAARHPCRRRPRRLRQQRAPRSAGAAVARRLLEPLVKDHIKRLRVARAPCASSSAAGTTSRSRWPAPPAAATGATPRGPGTMTHWPGGLALAFPAAGSVNGTLVLAEGDVNLTFKRYIERPVTLAHRERLRHAHRRARASTPT